MKLVGIEYLNKIEELHDEIKNDIVFNIKEVINRRNFYRRKFRCQLRNLDVSVGIFRENYDTYTIRIFCGKKTHRISSDIIINEKYNILTIKSKEYKNDKIIIK